ncbi:MAG: Zn-dependent alcohol dehydrogenase [Alphaproteobacteria bacterium]
MKAAVCQEHGQPLVIEDLELDGPGPGEVRVKLAACAICHSDIHYVEGAWGGKLPILCGHEASGVVEEVGAGVTGVALDDHVVVTLIRSRGHCFYCLQGDPTQCETKFPLDAISPLRRADGERVAQGIRTGAFAEYVMVHESQLVTIPKSMPLESAAILACGVITGLGAVVNTAKVPSGSSVAVIGTGGIGLNSVQGARLCGAETIIAVDLLDSKLETAMEFGATHGVNAGAYDAAEAIRELTHGRGVDYVFMTVGSTKAVEQGISFLRPSGTMVIVGMPAAGAMAEFEPLNMADIALRIIGSKMGGTRIRVDIPRLVGFYEQGRLKLDELISNRYPIDGINDAIAEVNSGEVLRNVIVF